VEKQWFCTKLPDVNEHECTKTSSHYTSGFIPFKLAPHLAVPRTLVPLKKSVLMHLATTATGAPAEASPLTYAHEHHTALERHYKKKISKNAAQGSVPSNSTMCDLRDVSWNLLKILNTAQEPKDWFKYCQFYSYPHILPNVEPAGHIGVTKGGRHTWLKVGSTPMWAVEDYTDFWTPCPRNLTIT